jgi:hypothetical protein
MRAACAHTLSTDRHIRTCPRGLYILYFGKCIFFLIKRGSVSPWCTPGSAILVKERLRNASDGGRHRAGRIWRRPRSVKSSFYQTSDGYTRDPMIPSSPFRFRAHGAVCERVWWTTPDLNPPLWTPEPDPLGLRFVLEWRMVCGVLCGVCGVLCGVCGVRCMCYGPCRRAGLVNGRVLMSQAWRQSRRRDRVAVSQPFLTENRRFLVGVDPAAWTING